MIEILSTPPLNTVQDAGSDEHRAHGFGPAGAMDLVGLNVANALLGNPPDAACIEVQMFPLRARFTHDADFAITGAASASLDGVPLPPWWARRASAGQSLLIQDDPATGARAYLALGGGIDVPLALGSRSTRPAGIGGHEGRPLKTGDRLKGLATASDRSVGVHGMGAVRPHEALPDAQRTADGALHLRVLRAGEHDQLDAPSQKALWKSTFTVSARSNRQGYRLEGAPLKRTTTVDMRSQPLVPGIIQLTPNGTLIVQMSDTNAAGGYPRVGVVIEADLWKLGQARPGQALRFIDCAYDEAVEATRRLHAYLGDVRHTVALWSRA